MKQRKGYHGSGAPGYCGECGFYFFRSPGHRDRLDANPGSPSRESDLVQKRSREGVGWVGQSRDTGGRKRALTGKKVEGRKSHAALARL